MISGGNELYNTLKSHTKEFHQVVKFNPVSEKIISFDLSENNIELKKMNTEDIDEFSKYIFGKLKMHNAKFGYGGYNELRLLYSRSNLFDNNLIGKEKPEIVEEPRRLHIGVDIWGIDGTPVYAPLDGRVHSFAYNDHLGDYGATIILSHQVNNISFHTLYGHISLYDIKNLKEVNFIRRGQLFAHFGKPEENGHWPPHLHFQIIKDINTYHGDYPGVSKFSEREKYLLNSPDPDVILNMKKLLQP